MALTVTLLGGESTGKTALAQAMRQRLNDLSIANTLVPEQLRLWCEQKGRAPLVHEQFERAQAQSTAIAYAAEDPDTEAVLADTTALVIAAYSELYFNDTSLWPDAIAQQRRYDLTLLMGLDLPWVPDGLFRDSPLIRNATDTLLRRELQAAGIPFQTIYGRGEARLQQALRAVGSALGRSLNGVEPEWGAGRVAWNCDRCSDPACEHLLFSRLL